MGCHTWTYIKIKTLNREQIDRYKGIAKDIIEDAMSDIDCEDKSLNAAKHYANKCYKYYLDEQHDIEEMRKLINDDFTQEEFEYNVKIQCSFYTEYKDKEYAINEYYERQKEKVSMLERIDKSEDLTDVIDILKRLIGIQIKKYRNSYYIGTKDKYDKGGDCLFRIYGYPENKFTDPEKLIDWLHKKYENTVEYYVDLDDEKNYEKHTGMTPELEERIRRFWQNHNDNKMLIEFG